MDQRLRRWIVNRLNEGYSPEDIREVLRDSQYNESEVDKVLVDFYESEKPEERFRVSKWFSVAILLSIALFVVLWAYPSYKLTKERLNLTYNSPSFHSKQTKGVIFQLNHHWNNKLYYMGENRTNKSISLKNSLQMPPILRKKKLKKYVEVYVGQAKNNLDRLIEDSMFSAAVDLAVNESSNEGLKVYGGAKNLLNDELTQYKAELASYKNYDLIKLEANVENIARDIKKSCDDSKKDCNNLSLLRQDLRKMLRLERRRVDFLASTLDFKLEQVSNITNWEDLKTMENRIELILNNIKCERGQFSINISNKGGQGFKTDFIELKVINPDEKSINLKLTLPKVEKEVGYSDPAETDVTTLKPANNSISGSYGVIYKIHTEGGETLSIPTSVKCS